MEVMTKLINFINQNENWEKLLQAPPYCLHIKHDGEYVLIKYDGVLTDFSFELCKEARGIIIKKDENNTWYIVARGFDKFFNYNEIYSDLNKIDWNNCTVSEKIDGTNIRIYMNDGYWHVSTLGCVNAFAAEFINGITYGELVNQACGGTIENLTNQLSPFYCYYFELTGPNKSVINYGSKPTLWYLGRRNLVNFKEDFSKITFKDLDIHYPRIFDIKSLQACIKNTEEMSGNEEGYVVTSVDDAGEAHRIKIKGAEYLRLHKIRCNGVITVNRAISMWRDNTLDDYISTYPEYKEFIDKIFSIIKNLSEQMEQAYNSISISSEDKKSIAIAAHKWMPPIPPYIFARVDNKVNNAMEFIEKMPVNKLVSIVTSLMEKENNE